MAIKESHGHRPKFVEEIDYDEIEKLEVFKIPLIRLLCVDDVECFSL